MNYALHLLIYFSIYGILALSLNLIVGYCGLITLAHSAYFAIGAYVYALLSLNGHSGFLLALTASAAVPMVFSLAVSLPAWRFKGDLFVMVSLAVQACIFSVLQNWTARNAPLGSWQNLTNGPFGIAGVPKPSIFHWQADSMVACAMLSMTILVACGFVVWRLVVSPWGRLLQCLRDDELAARSLGIRTRKAKVEAFALSCGISGIAGALYASYVGFIDPSAASLDQGILLLCMVIIGGVGNFKGPLVGATALVALPEALRFIYFPPDIAANMRLLLFGLLLVFMAHFRPQGLAGTYRFQ